MLVKQAFTFAELMVSLVVIAVITVILYPLLADMAPNNNNFLFKSAYKITESTMAEITSSGGLSSVNNQHALCKLFAERINAINATSNPCGNDDDIAALNNPNFQADNGSRWFFEHSDANYDTTNCPSPGECHYRVWVDVNSTNDTIANDDTAGDGPAVWAKGMMHTGDEITQDTFSFLINDNGKIIVTDPIAIRHLSRGN